VESPEELITYSAEHLLRERNVLVRAGAKVESIRHASRQVVLTGGERLHYDKLVTATGGRPDQTAAHSYRKDTVHQTACASMSHGRFLW
jgi:NADPH-dependent 2,4-dienoyl-CoA reductase/sulfur reductase-like enzyme